MHNGKYPKNVYQIWDFIFTYADDKAFIVEHILIGQKNPILNMRKHENTQLPFKLLHQNIRKHNKAYKISPALDTR